jgi:methyl-accepting chemotaxis protein
LGCALAALTSVATALAAGDAPAATPDEALQRLQDGNQRFVSGAATNPNTNEARRTETARNGQHPFATVLTCSDSRCPVERLFDQGIGDVFVVRVAGNVAATDEIGSIEYGVGHLETPLLVVLGHTQCGAVTAVATGAEVSGSIPRLVAPIGPAVARAHKEFPDLKGKDLVPQAIRANIWQAIDDLLRTSPEVRERVQSGKVKIVGALYHIEDGKVEWLGTHPDQERLLAYTGGAEHQEANANAPAAAGENPKGASTPHTAKPSGAAHAAGADAREALRRLKDGQARYASGKATHPDLTPERVAETAQSGQHPFVTIVGCSDSRAPPELLFDQGIGDLFVVRVAGNVCATDEIGSVEYGTGHLETPLLLVLGHTSCGAVTAVATDAELHGSIPRLVAPIKPAVAAAKQAHPGVDGKDLVPAAIHANVLQSMEDVLRRSDEVRELVRAGKLTVLGGVYDIEAGTVEWLGPHPQEQALVTGGEERVAVKAHDPSPAAAHAPTGQADHVSTAADDKAHAVQKAPVSTGGSASPAAPAAKQAPARAPGAAAPAEKKPAVAAPEPGAAAHGESRTGADSPSAAPSKGAERNRTESKASGVSTPNTPPTKERSSEATEHGRSSATSGAAVRGSDSSYLKWVLIGGLVLIAGMAAFFGSQTNMFKKMKLGTKIAFGFTSLIVIAVALGGLAVFSMYGVKTVALTLSQENVPEVGVATNVERSSLHTMYEMRGYNYTEEKSFLDGARKNLADVKKYLNDAKEHANKYDLVTLRENAAKAETSALEYERLLDQTVTATEAMGQEKAASLVAADKYMKICAEFLQSQSKTLDGEIDTALKTEGTAGEATQSTITAEKLKERYTKTVLCNDVIDLGNNIRLGTWQAIATRDPKLFTETEKRFEEVNKKLDQLKAITRLEVNLKEIEDCRAAGKEYLSCMERFLVQWLTREDLGKKRGAAADQVLAAAKDTSEFSMKDTQAASTNAASSLGTASTIMIIGLSVGVLVGLLLAFFITRSITGPIRRIIGGLTEGADQVTDAAAQVAAASQQLAEGNSEQASSLEETSSALEQMAAMTRTNAENSKQANELAGQARQTATESDKSMVQLNAAMTGISESSGKISKIIKVIEEIAFQTNLLALNAAVEAARAGEHGKGFAVVAEEVRNLAQRCAGAAKDTTSLIEDAVHRAQQGTQVSGEVGKSLGAIVEQATKVSNLINGIARASQEQAQGVEQVNTAVSQMDKVTQQNSAGAEESASAAEELSAQALTVKGMVNELVAMVGGAGEQSQNHAPVCPPVKKSSQKTTLTHAPRAPIKARAQAGGHATHAEAKAPEAFPPAGESGDLKEF